MRYYLTEEEKRHLREKYLENVNKINKYLSDENKIKPNLRALNRRLNDPAEQRKYKKGMEMVEKQNKRLKIYNELFNKYQHLRISGRPYFLDRSIVYALDEREGAEEYNDALIKTYMLHPEAVSQYFYQKSMQLNPDLLLKSAKCRDYGNLFIEYYDRNRESSDYAFVMKDGYSSKYLSNSAEKYMDILRGDYQIFQCSGFYAQRMDEGYFTVPRLNDAQRGDLMLSEFTVDEIELQTQVSNANDTSVGEELITDIKEISKNADKLKLDINEPGGLCNYIARDKVSKEIISLTDYLSGKIDNDAEIVKLDEEEKKDVLKFYERDYITEENLVLPKPLPKDMMNEYLTEFKFRYAINNNKQLHKLDEKSLSDLINGVRRGIFEAMFRSTSKFTKSLKEAIKDFETSPDNKNIEKLKKAAEAYLEHRGVNDRTGALRQGSAAKNRSLLCLDIIDAYNTLKNKEIIIDENEIKNDKDIITLNENKSKVIFVDAKEIIGDKEIENKEEGINTDINTNNKEFYSNIKEKIDENEIKIEDIDDDEKEIVFNPEVDAEENKINK